MAVYLEFPDRMREMKTSLGDQPAAVARIADLGLVK